VSLRTIKRDAACLTVLVALVLAWTGVSSADQPGAKQPAKIVESLHNELLGVMKEADELGYQGRYLRLKPVLDELFDIPFMAMKSVGRHWKTVDEQKRERLLATFGRFTVANYAGRFSAYSDQYFETLKVVESTHGTYLVHSKLVTPNGETVQLNYRLRPADDGWRIIDVYLNGTVSELALRRSEYSSLIQREGFDALLTALDERISALESESSEAAESPS
jgi:phospholipid transport system substrate-binding protein